LGASSRLVGYSGACGGQHPGPRTSHLPPDQRDQFAGLIGGDGVLSLLAGLLVAATVTTVLGCVSAAGEEIGWWGYMLTRLIEGGIRYPVLAGGVIWALWHVPLIVMGVYVAGGQQSMVVTLTGFMVSVVAVSFVFARFRLQTGSIWPAIVLHGAWNSVIQTGFDPAAAGTGAHLWLGESGILVALTLVVAAVLVSLGRWRMLRAPGRASPHATRSMSSVGRCYMNSSPQWLQVPKPIVAKLYCLQDGHRVTCVPQSIHLTVSFDRQALQSRLGNFRASDSKIDPLRNVPTIDFSSSSIVRATNPVCRSQPGQTAIASRSVFATWSPSH
jgi:membrane protease YdiL (CAAX protease family)